MVKKQIRVTKFSERECEIYEADVFDTNGDLSETIKSACYADPDGA